MSAHNWQIKRHDGTTLDPVFYESWIKLHAVAADTTLFHHPDWVLNWFFAFGVDKKFLVFSIHEGEKLVGVAPFIMSEIRRGPDFFTHHYQQPEDLALLRYRPRAWFRLRQLSLAVNLQSSNVRGGWLFAAGYEETGLKALFRHLANWEGWDMLNLPSWKSESVPALEHAVGDGGLSLLHRYCHELYGFTPKPWDIYYAERSKRFRKSYRGVFNRLKALGQYQILASTTGEGLESKLNEFFNLARRCWKEAPQEEQSVFIPLSAATESFYRNLCTQFGARGQCQLYSLYLDGQMIGGLLCLTDKQIAYAMLTYYDPAFAAISPGRFPIQAMIDWCGTHDIHWVDLNGNSKVVMSFMDSGQSYDQVAIFRKEGYSRWLYRMAKAKMGVDRLRGHTKQRSAAPQEEKEEA